MDRISKLRSFLAENPQDDFLNYALAQEYIGLGDDAQAEAIFLNLLEWHPNYVATYYHLGKLLERKGNIEEAKQRYTQGIEIAKKANDRHSLSELQSAFLELEYD